MTSTLDAPHPDDHFDKDGFPIASDEHDGEIYLSADGVTYVCLLDDEFGWCWQLF